MNDGLYTNSRDAIAVRADRRRLPRRAHDRCTAWRSPAPAHSAAVQLAWDVGRRYRFGAVQLRGLAVPQAGFLRALRAVQAGRLLLASTQLLHLQQALTGADYFSVVNVQPDVEHPHDGMVDVDVQLKPAKRSVYTGGPFIGTDTGLGMRLGLDRRWVNNRGHNWKNQLVIAQRLKTLGTLYQIPLPGPRPAQPGLRRQFPPGHHRHAPSRARWSWSPARASCGTAGCARSGCTRCRAPSPSARAAATAPTRRASSAATARWCTRRSRWSRSRAPTPTSCATAGCSA